MPDNYCATCYVEDYEDYIGWIPACCWDDSSTSRPCPDCNADGNKPRPT